TLRNMSRWRSPTLDPRPRVERPPGNRFASTRSRPAAREEEGVMTTATRAATVAFVVLAVSSAARAQTVSTTAGAVNGTVTDATKAVLPGVTVTVSGPAVMGAQTTITDR